MSPAKALRLSVARAADELWDLAVAASGIALTEESQEAAVDSLPEGGLILLLEGPEGAVGAAHLPFPVVSGLVEAQTIGQVSTLPPEPRAATRTDAAMVAPLIDETLHRFESLLQEEGQAPWALGYRFGTMMESARMLALALKATDFHVIRFSLDLAARREGEALLMLPVVELPGAGTGASGGEGVRQGALEAQILQAPTELRAVLHRLSMPLSAVSGLEVGAVLPIPREALARTEIEVGGEVTLGTTTLGQVNGMRALRFRLREAEDTPPEGQGDPGQAALAAPEVAVPGPADMEVATDEGLSMPMPGTSLDTEEGFAPAPMPQQDDLLGDLPDLGDLSGLDATTEEGEESGDLPDIGAMPMAALPIID